METLLPSEVARLVLGYLQDNCEDAARIFLEQSSHLSECLELAKQGRKYTTKVMGNSLMDLLQEYCAVHSLVSERAQKLPENAAEQLKQSASLVQKLKFLIDASKSGQTFLLSITVPSQGAGNQTGSTPASSGRSKSWLQCSSERAKRSGVRSQKSKDKEDRSGRRSTNNSVEATPLHSLPGLSPAGNWSSSRERVDSNDDQADAPGCSPASCSTPRRKGPPPRKKLSTSLSKLKKTHSEENDSNESVDITVLQQALLENKQLHEKIAENINRVMRIPSDGPSESQPPVAPLPESLPVPCDGMMNELDQAIKTIVHQTEQDPLFESFLEEILGPIEEEVSSSPAAGDCESDTEETGSGSPHPREVAAEEDCLNTPRASHLVDEESTPAPGEVPLKQRLRSARNRMSDGSAPTPSTPSTHGNLSLRLTAESPENEAPSPATKEQRKKESLLEEQNAAAIQSIITANIEKTVSDGSKTAVEKEADINMDKQQLSGTHLTENRDRKSGEVQLTVNSHPENGEAENSAREAHLNTGQNYVTEISVPDNSGASETVENCSSQQQQQQQQEQEQVNCVGSKGGDSHLTVLGGSSSENRGLSGTVMTAVTGHSNEGSTAADSGTTFSSATSVTVPVSIQPSCIWEGLPVILATPPDSQKQKGGVPIVQPVHVPVAVERGRMVLAVERPATATVAPAPLAVSLADQHPAVATSSIILYNNDRHFQPFTSTNHSPNFATIDATQPLSIAPKGTKISVRETQGTGENIVLSSITKMVAVNKQDIAGVVDPALTDNKKNVHKKSSSSKKKTKKKLGSKKNVSSHEKKKPAVATQHSKKKSSALKKGNEKFQKSEKNLASESSIIVMDGAPGISLSIPDISYNDSRQFGVTKEIESRIQVTSSFESSVKSTESSMGVYRHKSQDIVKDKDMPLVNNDSPNRTHLGHTNSLLKPVSEIGAYNVLCSNEKSVNPEASSGAKQKPESDDTVHKPRQTPQVRQDISKNTAEKSGSDCKPRQTPLVRRTSAVAGGRLSLSTPRRRTSHIRALDFGTPPKSVTDSLIKRRSNSAPKDTAHDANTSCSPDSSSDSRLQQAKNVRSSLFKSPDLMASRQHSNMLTPSLTVPIATRTPTPKLSGDWEKITGAGLIFGNSSPLLASPTREENNEPISSGQRISTPVEEDRNSTERPSSPVEVVLESSDDQKNDLDRCATPAGKQEGALAVWRKSILNYSKCKEGKRPAWDADLRAIVAQDYQENIKKPTGKKKTVKRVKKKVDKETEEEARLVESRLERMMEEIGHKETAGDELTPEEDISGTVTSVEEGTVDNKSLDTSNENTGNVPVNTACLEPKQMSDKTLVLLADTSTTSANVEEEFVTSSEKTANTEPDESSATSEQVGNSKFVRPKQTSSKQISKNRKRKASGVSDEAPKKRQKVKASSTVKEKKLKVKITKGGNDNTISSANDSVIPATRGLGAPSSSDVKVFSAEMDVSELGHTSTKANTKITATVTDATSTANSTASKETPNVASHSVCKEINVSEAFISTAALETPQKVSPTNSIVGTGFQIPITPRIMSPSTLLDTPISNFLREQPSIDLSMIPTPNFPPTPNIAVTPHSAELNSPTSYASRPTDYSSCSSYYKPSHSPSRSLEQVLIDECNRIESSVSPDRVDFKRSTAVCRKEMAESQEVCISIPEEDGTVIQAEQQVTAVIYNNESRRDVSTAGDTQTTSEVDATGEAGLHSTDIEKSDKKETSVKTHNPEVLEENSGSAVYQHHNAQFTVENSVIVSKQSMTATSEISLSQPPPSTNKECQSETDNIVVREEEERLNETQKLQPDSEISCIKENFYDETVKTAKILNVPVGQHGTSGQLATLKGNNNKRNTTSGMPEPDRRTKRRISHSAIDLSVSSELETKKNRMMAKLKGGTCDTVKGTKVKDVMKKDKRRKKDSKPFVEKENNEKVLCEATASSETVASEETSASKETSDIKENATSKENEASKETLISKEPAASKETVIRKKPAAIKETVISKAPAASKETVISKEPAAIKETVISKAPAVSKETVISKEPAAIKETVINKEPAASKKTPVDKETAANKETPVRKETAASKETPVSKETAATKTTPVTKETAATKETPVSQKSAATKETPVSKENAATKEIAVSKETVASKEHSCNKETTSGKEISVSKETGCSKETSGLEMSGLENIGCEECVLTEKVSVVIENVSTVIRSSQESPASKSVSNTERGTESLTPTVTPQKGILLRRQGISVDIIAERLMEAQNPVVNRMTCSKETESKSFNESHLTAHLRSSQKDDMVECTAGQQALVSNIPSAHSDAPCPRKIDTSQATIGSQNEKRKSQIDHNVPRRRSLINDESDRINSSEEKDCEVPHKNQGSSSHRSSKKNRNTTEISTEPESCNLIDVEETGREMTTISSTANEIPCLQKRGDNRNLTNKKPDVAHKIIGKEVRAKDYVIQRKKNDNNRKSLKSAEYNRENTSIKKPTKLSKENIKDHLNKSVVDSKRSELSNISVAEKCNVQDTSENSSVHQYGGVGRNERSNQGIQQPLDMKEDHEKEEGSTKIRKSTKSRNETGNEDTKIAGNPVIVEKGEVQDTLKNISDIRHHRGAVRGEKRRENIQQLNMKVEHDSPETTTVKTSTQLRKENIEKSITKPIVDGIYSESDNICSKLRAVEQDEMQNTIEDHVTHVDISESNGKGCDDNQPSFVCNKSADSSNMYVIIQYEGNGPCLQKKDFEDLSNTTLSVMDEEGAHTLSVTKFFDLLTISPEKVSPRAMKRSTNVPDLTPKAVCDENSSVAHTKTGGSVAFSGSLHLKHSPKKSHHSGHSRAKTSHDRRREVKHTNSSYKHRTGDKSLKASESRSSHKTKRLFHSPDKIMSKYRHGVRGSPRSTIFQRDRSVTPSRAPPRRPSTDGTKPRRLPLKSPQPMCKVGSTSTVDSISKRGTPILRLKDVHHKSCHKRESVYPNPLKKCFPSGIQVEGENVKHKKEKCAPSHMSNSSDSRALRYTRDSLPGSAFPLLQKVRKDASVTDSGNDLMTYALIGSVREDDSNSSTQQQYSEAASRGNWSDSHSSIAVATSSNEDVKILPPKKRKPSTEDGLAQVEKKIHTEFSQKLLKGIDVDNFLNYVHDGEKSHKD